VTVSSANKPPGPHPLAGTAPDAVLIEEDALRPSRIETVVWFDTAGRLIGRKPGQPTQVQFTADELAVMTNAIVTHNHPLGWGFPPTDPRRAGNSFSDDDFAFAIAADAAEFRAVTPLLRFSIARPPGGWGVSPSWIRLLHGAQALVIGAELDLAVATGRMSLEEREATAYHEVAQRLAPRLGFRYARWEG
jgi:hypothetical protein